MKMSSWRLASYALIIFLGFLVALPNVLPPPVLAAWPSWLPGRQVTLGLDLRGGSHLVLKVDEEALVREQLESMADLAQGALADSDIPGTTVEVLSDAVRISIGDPATLDRAEAAVGQVIPRVTLTTFGPAEPAFTLAREGGALDLALSDQGLLVRRAAAIGQSIEIVRRRIDEAGVAEPSIQRVGGDRIMVQLPGVQDPAAIRKLLGSTAKLSFHRVEPAAYAGDRVPPGYRVMESADGLGRFMVEERALLQGDRLAEASAGFDQETGEPIVQFRFDQAGAVRFGEITSTMVGQPFAIVLDDEVLSAPVIREPILGGSGQISGQFTVEETTTLSALLRAGALPVPLEVIEERTVGPDLGQDAIEKSAWSGLVGFGLVFAVMVGLYGVWGLVANAALAINVVLTIAALSLIGATLTLPGIAGIILGLGLAVDANILINERIREETRRGRRAAVALQTGFDRAYRTIVDSNVTTLLATFLLFWFGSGPVRGFAVTMGLGIAISMFTAVAVVKGVMATHLRIRRPKFFEIRPLFHLIHGHEPHFRFMRARFLGLAVSLTLSVASIVLFVQPGLNYGIDFKGGILIEAKTEEPADLAQLRSGLERLSLGDVALQQIGDASSVLVRIEKQPGGEAAQTAAAERAKAAIATIEPDASFERVEVVGPRVSGELARTGLFAVVAASLAMLGYIWARFEWPFAVGAIATVILDVTKTVGFFALTGLDFGLTAIAALLTLIGYSVNDKVVVYDRMRENMRLYKAMPLRDLIDLSINQTLARSLYTSLTTLVAILPLAIWGGAAVRSFAIPVVFGIIVAASSSVFIAAPILLFLGDWRRRRRPTAGGAATGVAGPSPSH